MSAGSHNEWWLILYQLLSFFFSAQEFHLGSRVACAAPLPHRLFVWVSSRVLGHPHLHTRTWSHKWSLNKCSPLINHLLHSSVTLTNVKTRTMPWQTHQIASRLTEPNCIRGQTVSLELKLVCIRKKKSLFFFLPASITSYLISHDINGNSRYQIHRENHLITHKLAF